jgi:hypothetical protein
MSAFSSAPYPSSGQTVARADVLRQLNRIVSHPLFLKSERLSAFLRYTVETTLAGEADSLKEIVIGAEVFRRGDSFDSQTDNLVRVTANRLRSKLAEYYHRSGQSDTVVIDLPKGRSVALFSTAPAAARGAAPAGVVACVRTSVGRERRDGKMRRGPFRKTSRRSECVASSCDSSRHSPPFVPSLFSSMICIGPTLPRAASWPISVRE